MKPIVTLIVLAHILLACGDAEFLSSQGVVERQPNQGAKDDGRSGSGSLGGDDGRQDLDEDKIDQQLGKDEGRLHRINPDQIFGNSDDDRAMNRCFKEWGETPFDAQAAKAYRVFNAASKGFSSPQIADRTNTKTASLVLVKIKAEGFSAIEVDLGNPNGWYCIQSSAVGFTSFKLRKHCRATIGNMQSDMTGFSNSQNSEYGDEC